MNKNIVLVITLLLVLLVVVELIFSALRKGCQRRMVDLLENRDYNGFDAYSGKAGVKLLVPAYTAKVMKLNMALQEKDAERIERYFEEIEALKLTDQQRCDIALRGFYHYLPQRDRKKCGEYVAVIQKTAQDEAMKEAVTRFYDVLIEKKDELLPTLLAEMEEQEELNRYTNEYLVSEIYRNRGEEQEAKQYAELSQRHKREYLRVMKSLEFGKKNKRKA